MKDFTIATNGTTLHGSIAFNPQAKDILVTLHGGPGGNKTDMQQFNVCQKLEKEYIVVYFDQRGCGQSKYDLRLGLDLSVLLNDVKCIIEYVQKLYPTLPISLFGTSYGGFLGFAFIEKYPTIVKRYIACNPAITFSKEEGIALAMRNQARYQERFSTLDLPYQDITNAMKNPDFIDFIFSSQNTSNSLRYIYAIHPWFFSKNFTKILENITIPTIIQQGKLDPICDEKAIHQAITKIKNKHLQYICLDTCAHDVDDVNGTIMVENIHNFINKN